MTFKLPPYLVMRDGRPRWVPGPRIRHAFKGQDLKDANGNWLGLEAAIARAKALNAEVASWKKSGDGKGASSAPRAIPKVNPAARRTLNHLYQLYASPDDIRKASPKFQRLAPSTQSDYRHKLEIFLNDDDFGDENVAALTQADLYTYWEKAYTERGHAMANGIIACVRAMLSYAVLKGWREVNPAKSLGIEKTQPRIVVWTPSELEAFVAKADELGYHGAADAVVIGLHTGQRQGDVLHFEWISADGGKSRFKQRKTGAFVAVPYTDQLADRIENIRMRRRSGAVAELQLTGELVRDTLGRHYTKENFGRDFRAVREAVAQDQTKNGANEASILGKQYLDLRDTAITRLALAECTVPEIRAITGHTLDTIHKVLAHYLALDDRMADAAIRKLKNWMQREGIAI